MSRHNPFVSYYRRLNAGDSREKFETMPDFPVMLDVELTNVCNFRCLMCATGVGAVKRPKGFMEESTFRRLLECIGKRRTPLRFIRWGEPTLHPRWREFMAAARQSGCLVHFNTNGSRLDREAIADILRLGLESIKFSFQGVDAVSYREMRNIDFFPELLDTIRLLNEMRGQAEVPYIQVATTVTDESQKRIDAFKRLMAPLADYVSVSKTVLEYINPDVPGLSAEERQRLAALKKRETSSKVHPHCPEVFGKLSVNWDGTVSACCSDYDNLMLCGDIRHQSLEDIWNGDRLATYRRILLRMEHDRLPLCRRCYA